MPKKRRKSPQKMRRMGRTNPARCVGVPVGGAAIGFEHHTFEPFVRMAIPSVQDALGCVRRMKSALGVSVVDLASVIGFPRSTVADWFAGRSKPEVAARHLLPRLERELIPQDEYQELFPPTTGSVQPAPDVIIPSKPGNQA